MDGDMPMYSIYDPSANAQPEYIIEGGLSFQQMLNESSDEEDEAVEKCLISNMPLDKTKVKLSCSHSFNYFYLYKEVFAQKYGTSKYNMYTTKNNIYKSVKGNNVLIECPYCREVTYGLLPRSLDLKCPDKTNVTIPSTYSIKIQCSVENCNSNEYTYVTPEGYLCGKHYMGTKIKRKRCKNNKNTNIIIDSSMNAFGISSPSQNDQVTAFQIVDKLYEIGKYPEHFTDEMKSYMKKHTVEFMKNVLKANLKKVSGVKTELVERIFSNNLQIFELY